MSWKPKIKKTNQKRIGKSIIKKLRSENKSSEDFEILVNKLTLEELICLKLELGAKQFTNNKMFGFPLWYSFPKITKEAILNFALYATSSKKEAARFLGI